jgi:ATP-dependent Lhr-like helicase
MPLSSEMGEMIRYKLQQSKNGKEEDPEMIYLRPMLKIQQTLSVLPDQNEFLIEGLQSKEGFHVMMYPFEGRFVHEGMAALVAYRISKITPITFSIAMNDYGFELLSDQEIPIQEAIETNILGVENLHLDIQASINSIEMARRKFRDIAAIAGLVFKGYPGQRVKDRHLQSSSQLFFEVFHDHESHNLLLLQAFEEVMDFQLEETRMRNALDRIAQQKIIIRYPDQPTPFAFPIMVDRLREKLTSEKLEDRVSRMMLQYQR